MGWSDFPLTSLTLPQNAGPGQARIFIGQQLPPPLSTYMVNGFAHFTAGIVFYSGNASDDNFEYICITEFTVGQFGVYWGAVVAGAVVENAPGDPMSFQFFLQSGVAAFFTEINHGMAITQYGGISTQYPNRVTLENVLTYDPNTVGTPEAWHAATLTGGWSNFGGGYVTTQYRKVPSPSESAQLVGTITGGTATPGTVIMTLPAGYRPATIQRQICYAFGGTLNLTTETPAIDIFPSGQVKLVGTTNAGVITFNAIYPLDA